MIEECICSLMVKKSRMAAIFVSGGARAGFGI
jgi:spore maturation protein SpmB